MTPFWRKFLADGGMELQRNSERYHAGDDRERLDHLLPKTGPLKIVGIKAGTSATEIDGSSRGALKPERFFLLKSNPKSPLSSKKI